MKHIFSIILILLLLFLVNSCNEITPPISAVVSTAVINTQIAGLWTATPTQAYNPNILAMVNWMNADLLSPTNSLESTMDAKYSVTDIKFPHVPNSSSSIFRVDVGCICMNNTDCCIPERTFVVIIEIMKKNNNIVRQQVPDGVTQVMVVCSDPKARAQVGAISASWQDVQDYLQEHIGGSQLGMRTSRTIAPP